MKFFILTCLLYFVVCFISYGHCRPENIEKFSFEEGFEDDPDAKLLVPELIEKYGYPVETHQVETEDGYILELHRIPKPGATPVLIQHGLLASSAEWVIMGPEKGLAYYLSQKNYDVWMGNNRGNRYSKKHKSLSTDSKEFWDFSFNELGNYDLPAMIDHVLNQTNAEKIQYIGHSQGTTSFWAMCAQRPEYCNKIISMQALAPVAYLDYAKCPLIVALGPLSHSIEKLTKLMGWHEFLTNNEVMALAGQKLCKDEAVTQELCSNIVFLIAGYDSDQLNKSSLPAFLGHFPAGASSKQLIHFGQIRKAGKFQFYDYGWFTNLKKYSSIKPPTYNLSNVKVPVVLHYAQNDWLADGKDVLRLRDELPNIFASHIVPNSKFNHLDFLTAIDVKNLLYDDVIKMMKELE